MAAIPPITSCPLHGGAALEDVEPSINFQPSGRVGLRQLQAKIIPKVAADWFVIGTMLRVSEDSLDTIKDNRNLASLEEKAFEMFKIWLSVTPNQASGYILCDALSCAGHKVLAQEMREGLSRDRNYLTDKDYDVASHQGSEMDFTGFSGKNYEIKNMSETELDIFCGHLSFVHFITNDFAAQMRFLGQKVQNESQPTPSNKEQNLCLGQSIMRQQEQIIMRQKEHIIRLQQEIKEIKLQLSVCKPPQETVISNIISSPQKKPSGNLIPKKYTSDNFLATYWDVEIGVKLSPYHFYMQELSEIPIERWYDLGILLDINPTELMDIWSDNYEVKKSFHEMLNRWSQNDSQASNRKFALAIYLLKLSDGNVDEGNRLGNVFINLRTA